VSCKLSQFLAAPLESIAHTPRFVKGAYGKPRLVIDKARFSGLFPRFPGGLLT